MRPPPRIWWDGDSFHALIPPPRIDAAGRSTLPGLYRVEAEEDLTAWGGPVVELIPVDPAPGLDTPTADRVLAEVQLPAGPDATIGLTARTVGRVLGAILIGLTVAAVLVLLLTGWWGADWGLPALLLGGIGGTAVTAWILDVLRRRTL